MITIEKQTVIRASSDYCSINVLPTGNISVGSITLADPAEMIAFALALGDVADQMQQAREQKVEQEMVDASQPA
jgi:hypothetical protein